ncbi:hypothetical protein BP6252_13313 [Coleophoma cylindrospora]|uniref:Uncharacterized protein n=1 Tax=Coleophoma cylindrospora TaxID=1849047 RepID=A0A3D8QAX5_9HELO|nr:hypothetical protein BP6252_13313 [Coleophoma cylindrospora]
MGKLRMIFLQACESRDSVRYAIVALGALDMTSQASRPKGDTRRAVGVDYKDTPSHHYQSAIKLYTRAIKHAQMERETDLRTALITSLVILSFEGWIGNHEVALQQIAIGTRLVKEWKERYAYTTMSGYSSSESREDESMLSHVFIRLSIQSRAPPTNQPPPSASTPLPPLKIDHPEGLQRIPESFESLSEAGKFYGAIVKFAVSFVAQGMSRIARATSLTGAYFVGVTHDTLPPEITKAQAILTESLHRWMTAFTRFKTVRKFKTLEEKKAAITLELQMKATYMGAVKALAQDELEFDKYYGIYRDIVNLSEELLTCSNTSRAPRFSFDCGVIIPLWFTGHKCRDPILRRRVIALLINFPRREGVWDSTFAGLVIECVMKFEEQHMEKGKIPGWARVRNTSFDIDLEERTIEVKCQQRTSGTSEEVVTQRKMLDYYVHTGIALENIGAVIAR